MVRCRSQVFFEAKYRAQYVPFDLTLFFVSVDPTLPLNETIHFKYFKIMTLIVTFSLHVIHMFRPVLRHLTKL